MVPAFLFYAFCYSLIKQDYSSINFPVIAEGLMLLNNLLS